MRIQPATRKLRNAVATALIADVTDKPYPTVVIQRQVMISQALSRSLGMRFDDVLPEVKAQWHKVYDYVC